MSRQIVKTIPSPDGQRRVDIFERDDGFFGFVELRHYQHQEGSPSSYWTPVWPQFSSIAETLEIAEREARFAITWLKKE